MYNTIKRISVQNMVSRKGNTVPNQFIIYTDDGTYFQSYSSTIAFKDHQGNITLGKRWDFSATTGRYRNEFLNEGIADTRKKIEQGIYKIDESL